MTTDTTTTPETLERIAAYPTDHPRAWSTIIDVLRPDAAGVLRSAAYGLTVEELTARDGHAVRVTTWEAWQAGAAAAQAAVPVVWQPCPPAEFDDRLEVLPPLAWAGGSFLVGEAADHDFATGQPRYSAYRESGSSADFRRTYRSTRPVTRRELAANRHTAPGTPWSAAQEAR